jgi:hypothetical protein
MSSINVAVDSSELATLLIQAGWTVTPPSVVVTTPPPPPPPPVTVANSVIYDGKLEWPGDWSGGGVNINYANTTLVPGLTVASILNVNAYGYWLPYILHFATDQVKNLVLKLKPAVAGVGKFSLCTYTSTGSTTDIIVGGLNNIQLQAYASAPDSNDVVTYTVPLTALASANIDLYKILVQDQSGTKGTTWAVVDARFV